MSDYPFPLSSAPGSRPGEGGGRLVNAHAERDGAAIRFQRPPGLEAFAETGLATPRGFLRQGRDVLAAYAETVIRVAPDGQVRRVGALPGRDLVTFAANNRAGGPDVVAVRSAGGAYVVTQDAVSPYPGTVLPGDVNSVSFLDGFLIFTQPNGRIWASGLNTLDVAALSFATAENNPDGLLRAVVSDGLVYAMGSASIEPWLDVGAQPFPLRRGTSVIQRGLLRADAVAGHEDGWGFPPVFVADDFTIRILAGYRASDPISTPAVHRALASADPDSLTAFAFAFRGHAMWALSSDRWTWIWDAVTQTWHERQSRLAGQDLPVWRARRAIRAEAGWLVGDACGTGLLRLAPDSPTEIGEPIVFTAESDDLGSFPISLAVKEVTFRFSQAPGAVARISWSQDGGETWSDPVERPLDEAARHAVRVNRLATSGPYGQRLRIEVASPVPFSFRGATLLKPGLRDA